MLRYFLIGFFLLITGIVILVETPSFQQYLLTCATEKAEEAGFKVVHKDFHFDLPLQFSAKSLDIQNEKLKIHVENMVSRISVLDLLTGNISFSTFSAEQLTIDKEEDEHSPLPSIRLLPLSLDAPILSITLFRFNDFESNIAGNISIRPKKGTAEGQLILNHNVQISLTINETKEAYSIDALFHKNDEINGIVSAKGLKDSWNGLIKNIPIEAPPINGKVDVNFPQGNVQGNFNIHPNRSLSFEKIALSGPDLFLNGSASLQKDKQGYFAFNGKYKNKPLEVQSNILIDEQIALRNISAHFDGGTIIGNLDVNAPFISGSLHGEKVDFEALYPDLKGIGKLFIEFKTDSQQQSVHCTLDANRVIYSTLSAEKCHLNGQIDNVYGTPLGEITFSVEGGQIFNRRVADFTFKSSLNGPYILTTYPDPRSSITLESSGIWKMDEKQYSISIDTFKGEIEEQLIQLNAPFTISLNDQELEISPFHIQVGLGHVEGQISLTDHIDASIDISRVDGTILKGFTPDLPLNCILSMNCHIRGNIDSPQGELTFQIEDVRFQDDLYPNLPPLNSTMKSIIDRDRMVTHGTIEGLMPQPILLVADIPFQCSVHPLKVHVPQNDFLELQLTGEGSLGPILELIGADTTNAAGQVRAALLVKGTMNNPEVHGEAALTDGMIENFESGALLKNITISVEGDGEKIILKEIRGTDNNGGVLLGNGYCNLSIQEGFPFSIEADLDHIQLVNLDYTQGFGSGKVKLEGSLSGGNLSGDITADRINIVIPEEISSMPDTIDVTYINFTKDTMPMSAIQKPSSWPLELDVHLKAPGKISVRGNDLSSEWRGKVHLKGSVDTPEMFGDCKIIHGEYLFRGKKLQLNKATITFNGPLSKKTTMYIIATQEIDRYKIDLILKGPLKDPSLSLRSNPPLSEQEILSWFLFGKGMSNITPFEGEQITQTFTNLKNNKSGPNMLTKVTNSLGIDRIDINRKGGNNSEAVSVQVGKYITDSVFVGVNKNVSSTNDDDKSWANGAQLSIEAKVIKNIKVEAEVGNNNDSQVFLKWQKDY